VVHNPKRNPVITVIVIPVHSDFIPESHNCLW
jgi:hypothetical protein